METPYTFDEQDPRHEEADLVRRMYHASRANPDFEFAGDSGLVLSLRVVEAMEALGLPEAQEFGVRLARDVFEDLRSDNTHEGLTAAVKIAYCISRMKN